MPKIFGKPKTRRDNTHLKPAPYAETASVRSGASDDYYKPVAPSQFSDAELRQLEQRDSKIKQRIRILRLVSRVLAFITSGATVAPLTYTLVKYLQTRNLYYVVDGVRRTAWASGTIPYYSYEYFGVSAVSFLFSTVVLLSYCCGTKRANSTASLDGYWHVILTVAHIVMWIGSIAIYRYGKEAVNGRFTDLWGWTCSSSADQIQSQIPDINYSTMCTTQVRLTSIRRRLTKR